MKRETKVITGASIAAIGLLLIPMLVAKVRSDRDAELMARKPSGATRKFRDAIQGTTYINVFHIIEAGTPGNQIPVGQKPVVVLSGEKAEQIVRALHFGDDTWRILSGPFPGSITLCTALEFRSGQKKLADLRVGDIGLGARWYAPPAYLGDSFVLVESRNYLERQFNRRLDGR